MKAYTCTTLQQLKEAFNKSQELLHTKGAVNIAFTHKSLQAEEFDLERPRTTTQNKALHKYYSLLSDALNEAGYDMKKTLKESAEIPWTAEAVKLNIWKPVQDAMLDKKSTTELETTEVDEIYKVVDRHLSQKTGVHVEFPSRHTLAEIHR
jgi:hypothetical protein